VKNYALVFTPESLQEIKEVALWYNQQQTGLGSRFKASLRKELDKIKQNPFTRSLRYDDVRFAVLDSFPYAAHYTIDESTRAITIHAVLAFKQNPETHWKKRM
jgi:plasmid stabilization system protein ParE